MTTAHRPTWKAAVGQGNEGGWTAGGATSSAKSVLDMASHTKLKIRKGAQVVDRKKALKESLLKLEEAEKSSASKIGKRVIDVAVEEQGRLKLLKQTAEVDDEAIRNKYDDEDAGGGVDDDDSGGGWSDVDEDDDDLDASDSDEDSDSDDDDSDDDDEAALQAELAKIRAEREEKKRKEEEAAAAEEESKLEEAAVLGNPLLASSEDFSMTGKLKRKWNDDVVFRNQAKGEPEIKKRFINDTVRNDFHKRFLNKFIR